MTNPQAVFHSIEQLRSGPYLREVAKLPAPQQQVKHQLYEAFAALVNAYGKGEFAQAEQLAGRILSVATANPEAYLVMGHVCLDLFGNPVKARELLSEYVRKNKKNVSAWAMLCIACFRSDQFKEARKAGKEALKLDPKCVSVLISFGQMANAEQDFEAALNYTKQGLKIEPDNRVLLTNLGAMLQILGRKEEAEKFYRETLAKQPHFYHGYYGLAKLHRCKDANDAWLLQARQVADSAPPQAQDIEALYFALSEMYAACGNDVEAWRFVQMAQELLKRITPYSQALWDKRLEQTVGFYTPQFFAQAKQAEAQAQTQPIFIVGMPRSGTTLVEQILASHSQVAAKGELRDLDIVVSQMKSLFGTAQDYPEAMRDADEALLTRMREQYAQALLSGVPSSKRFVIDKMPSNFYRLGVVYQLFPQAKIIHCVRNPMDVCLSIYLTKFSNTLDWAHALPDIAHYYVNYRKLMAHWEQVLPMPIHQVTYETLVTEQQVQTEALLAFLELPWEESCMQFHRKARAVATASTWQVRQPLYTGSIEKWRRYEKELQPFIEGIGMYNG